MMFVVFILSLITLVMSTTLVLRAKKNADLGTGGCKFIGYLIGVLAIIMLVFSGYFAYMHSCRMWNKNKAMQMTPHQQMMQKIKMMRK